MILLDTNVLSEPMRPAPDTRVLAWMDSFAASELWISAVTQAEVKLGVALMPAGRRRSALALKVQALFEEDFAERCLAFDSDAADHYADIVASRVRRGAPISHEDAQIAAIARSHGFSLATRNLRDFAHIEALELLDPWA